MMLELAERAYFALCRAAGWLLRSGKYSKARIVYQDGVPHVRKYRLFYAPLLVWMVGPLLKILDTGVRVLPQREWEERERRINQSLRGSSIQINADGVLVLPLLAGRTLATLLEDPDLEESVRRNAIEQAVVALAEFHHLGFTHGDAMAENVMIEAPRRRGELPTGSTSRPFMSRVVRWSGDVPTMFERCSSPAWCEPLLKSSPRPST